MLEIVLLRKVSCSWIFPSAMLAFVPRIAGGLLCSRSVDSLSAPFVVCDRSAQLQYSLMLTKKWLLAAIRTSIGYSGQTQVTESWTDFNGWLKRAGSLIWLQFNLQSLFPCKRAYKLSRVHAQAYTHHCQSGFMSRQRLWVPSVLQRE